MTEAKNRDAHPSPKKFSDTVISESQTIVFHLSTLSNRRQEKEFERYAKRLSAGLTKFVAAYQPKNRAKQQTGTGVSSACP